MSVPERDPPSAVGKRREGANATRVELPRLLSVLSHEIRGPLSVLQGYIRLMQRQRDERHPETAMLKAMLDATGKITTLGRQASDLSSWLDPREAPRIGSVSLEALLAAIRTHVTGERVVVEDLEDASVDARLLTSNVGMLGAALAALAESLSRDLGNAPVRLRAYTGRSGVTVTLDPVEAVPAEQQASVAPRVNFNGGGLGLSLVLASYVLESHQAVVSSTGSSMMEVQLEKERGPE